MKAKEMKKVPAMDVAKHIYQMAIIMKANMCEGKDKAR